MSRILFAIFILSFTLVGNSCAPAQWNAVTLISDSPEPPTWPPRPIPPKARYLQEITGFSKDSHGLLGLLAGKDLSGRLERPVAVSTGKDGRLAIADIDKRGVHLYIPATREYKFIQKAGKEELRSPVGIAFDVSYDLYISDSSLKKVLIYNDRGEFLDAITSIDGEPFNRPTGLSFSRLGGLLHVVDTGSHQVHLFNTEKGYIRSIGSRGSGQQQFNFPTHVTLDYQERLYINDAMNFRIKVFDNKDDYLSDFGRHGNGMGDFAMPKGIEVDRWGTIYVADALFDTVQLFDLGGKLLLIIGSQGMKAGEFWMPSGIHIDDKDRLYVCDTYNKRVQVFQLYPNPE